MIVNSKKTLQLDKRARIKLRAGGRSRVKIRRVMLAVMMVILLAVPMVASAMEVDIPYQQTFTNDSAEASVADTFDYQLTAADASSPMPAGSSEGAYDFSLRGNSNGSLNLDIPFAKPGLYYYTVKSKGNPPTGYTYNSSTYTVMVMTVNGSDGLKVGAITIQDESLAKYDKLEFKTRYYKARPGGGGNEGDGNGGGGNGGAPAAPGGAAAAPAAPANPAPPEGNPPTTINDPEPPLAGIDNDYWALVNLICMLLTWLTAILGGIFYIRRRRQAPDDEEEAIAEAEEYEDPQKLKRKGWLRIGTVLLAIISLIAFILTEDMTLPMELVDEWTIWMIIFLAAALLLALVSRKVTEEQEPDPEG